LVQDDVHSGSVTAEPQQQPEPYGDIGMFHRSLAGLCRADLPLPEALRNLVHDVDSGQLKNECATMATEIEAGVPFEQAYGQRAERFPPIYRALVEAGIKSGDLPGVLDEIATDASLRARVRDQLRRRLEMPLLAAIVVFVIGAALTLLLTPVVPELPSLISGRPERLAGPPTLLLALARARARRRRRGRRGNGAPGPGRRLAGPVDRNLPTARHRRPARAALPRRRPGRGARAGEPIRPTGPPADGPQLARATVIGAPATAVSAGPSAPRLRLGGRRGRSSRISSSAVRMQRTPHHPTAVPLRPVARVLAEGQNR